MLTDTIRTAIKPGTQAHRYERSKITGHKLRATRWHESGDWIVYLRTDAGLTEIGSVHEDETGCYAQPPQYLGVPRKRVAHVGEGMVALDALLANAVHRLNTKGATNGR
jgi:hypothetical protein